MRFALSTIVAFLLLASPASAQRPNFVFVLADDLAINLVQYMPQVKAMREQGTSFDRYVVTNSLCCPSRASILTGRYPHSTGVMTNTPPFGGFEIFHFWGEPSTFATSLQAVGYRTALMGKYINGYRPGVVVNGAPGFVPPGWSAWAVAGNGYPNYNYNLLVKTPGDEPARTVRYGSRPEDYLTDVISRHGQEFIAGAVADGQPFLLQLAPFTPHAPYTPAPRHANAFPDLRAPRGVLFNARQRLNPPAWLPKAPLTNEQVAQLDNNFRLRAQSVLAIDEMVGAIRDQLRRLGVADNTYIVFSSDNGYHMGQRRLLSGKQTYFDHDVRVPLIVVGPGVQRGASIMRLAANVDLRPTFQELAGVPIEPRVEGRSLVGFLRGLPPWDWRDATLIEHRGTRSVANDPDAEPLSRNPPSYGALRFADALYVQYRNPAHAPEYYDMARDPVQRHNLYPSLSAKRRAALAAKLAQMLRCRGGASCQAADAQ
jgi:arylsulfatase A-like enzyme